MMEAVSASETLAHSQNTIPCNNPEDCRHSHRRGNLTTSGLYRSFNDRQAVK
jgi:hypothetical protein